MNKDLNPDHGNAQRNNHSFATNITLSSVTLPNGDGALNGIDEKSQVNPSNETAGVTIPLPCSPGRNGFTPSLSFHYNSGSGNGIFGIGWDLKLSSIQIKTDKLLPAYSEEDTYLFSDSEDLVPCLHQDGEGL